MWIQVYISKGCNFCEQIGLRWLKVNVFAFCIHWRLVVEITRFHIYMSRLTEIRKKGQKKMKKKLIFIHLCSRHLIIEVTRLFITN